MKTPDNADKSKDKHYIKTLQIYTFYDIMHLINYI